MPRLLRNLKMIEVNKFDSELSRRSEQDVKNEEWITGLYDATIACDAIKVKEIINEILRNKK